MKKNVMKKIRISGIGASFFAAGMLLLGACTKMDHYYKDYIVQRIYVGKPDSIWIGTGDHRVQIGMLTPIDAEARDLIVHWNATDSMVFTINPDVESQSFIIPDLEERDYVFNAFTSDRNGNTSVPMELSTRVYGDNFRSTIRERNLSHSVLFPDSVGLIWSPIQMETLYGVEISYTDKDGHATDTLVPATSIQSVFHHMDIHKPVSVRSAYRPAANAFEYFYTDPVIIAVEAVKRNTLTFSSTGYLDAMYVDFRWGLSYLDVDIPAPLAADIDLCYALGAGSRGNMFTMTGGGFSAFAANWQAQINAYSIKNAADLKLDRSDDAVMVYEGLDELDRGQMQAAYENSAVGAAGRISGLRVDDVIFLHVADRDMYVAMKVLATPPATSGALGDFVIEFKVSRP